MRKQMEPVRKSLELNCSIDHAFRVFTEKIDLWWPLSSHSCFKGNSARIEFEKKTGGRLIETSKTGETNIWGTILEWQPPTRLVTTWFPAMPDTFATKLTIEFEKITQEKTRLKLTHDGWEARGEGAENIREDYVRGWDFVLDAFITNIPKS